MGRYLCSPTFPDDDVLFIITDSYSTLTKKQKISALVQHIKYLNDLIEKELLEGD